MTIWWAQGEHNSYSYCSNTYLQLIALAFRFQLKSVSTEAAFDSLREKKKKNLKSKRGDVVVLRPLFFWYELKIFRGFQNVSYNNPLACITLEYIQFNGDIFENSIPQHRWLFEL